MFKRDFFLRAFYILGKSLASYKLFHNFYRIMTADARKEGMSFILHLSLGRGLRKLLSSSFIFPLSKALARLAGQQNIGIHGYVRLFTFTFDCDCGFSLRAAQAAKEASRFLRGGVIDCPPPCI